MKNWIKENLVATFFIITTFTLSVGFAVVVNQRENYYKQIKRYNYKTHQIPSSLYDSIYNEILNLRIEHPQIVYSQVIHETDSLRSDLFRTNHNLFGMKCCGNRATTSNEVRNGYAYYSHWRESLLDYALLQMSHYKNLTDDEYYDRLRLRYASDKKYIEKLKQYVK